MANAKIAIKEDAAPTKQLASQTTDTLRVGDTVHREEVVIGAPTVDAAVAEVVNAAPSTEYGLVTRNIPSGTQNIADGGGAVTVDALDLDIRNLTHASDSVRVGDGTDLALVTAAGELNVLATAQPGVDIGDVTVNNAAGASAVNIQDGGNIITVDGTVNIGTFPDNEPFNVAQYGGTAVVTGGVAGAIGVGGLAAHDVAAAGNPVLAGAQMETMADSAPGSRAGTDGDAIKLASADGALFVIPTGPQIWSYHENSSSALTDASVHATPGAGLSLYVTDIIVSTGAATALNIFFEEGASTVLGPYYLEAVAGRGFAIHLGTPKKITANTALTVTTSAAIAHGIDVTGFIAPG